MKALFALALAAAPITGCASVQSIVNPELPFVVSGNTATDREGRWATTYDPVINDCIERDVDTLYDREMEPIACDHLRNERS